MPSFKRLFAEAHCTHRSLARPPEKIDIQDILGRSTAADRTDRQARCVMSWMGFGDHVRNDTGQVGRARNFDGSNCCCCQEFRLKSK